jgi:nitroreductase
MKKVIKKIFPSYIVVYARRFLEWLKCAIPSLINRSNQLSNIYYLINSNFTREHRAVLSGRAAYYDSLIDIGKSCALLRRNVHRLEKGLIMRPRRYIFAEGYIQETVSCYVRSIKSTKLASNEKKWAKDVLDEYFRIVGSSDVIDAARDIYVNAVKKETNSIILNCEFPSDNNTFTPYPYSNLPVCSIDYEDLKQLYIKRRSVRWYSDKTVPLELVNKATKIASFAPSACNRQPYRFLFCNEKEKATKIAECAGGTAGFAENIPAIIVIVGDLSSYPYERDRHLIYIDGSLAAMQLMLALETIGLSSCPINWPDVEQSEIKLRNIIKLKNYERVVMLLAVGYADYTGKIPYSQKKDSNLILEDIS